MNNGDRVSVDSEAGQIMSNTIMTAETYRSAEINTLHLAMVMLADKVLADRFKEITGVDPVKFAIEHLETELEKLEVDYDKGNIELSMEDLADDMRQVLSISGGVASQCKRNVSKQDMFTAIISTPGTYFYNLLLHVGVPEDKLNEYGNKIVHGSFLESLTTDLNKLARDNELDPVESRDDIIDQVIEVLGRRQKGNPCLIGESGVGKTAIIEGLAQRINEGRVPSYLKGAKILSIEASDIVSGCKFRGDFENKFNKLIDAVYSDKNIILFFDEFHSLLNSGRGMDGGSTASDMLKPVLSRGIIRIIGATTTKEYNRFIESDNAFERRLQPIKVEEPSVEQAIQMVTRLIPVYNEYHNANITKSVVEVAVKLSDKYITNKRLPDKAITLIDETAARLKALNNGNRFTIEDSDIKKTLSNLTGIDINNMDKTDKEKLINLGSNIKKHLVGQDEAVLEVSKAIKRNKAGIRDSSKPIGSFLFVGPTGVGKTELCKCLANELFTSEKDIIRLDMSEYMEKHSVARLVGAPPGYIGHGEGGQLTDMVRNKPYSIILLDEIEKAHPDVFNIFLQIMDDGRLTDSKGVTVDFKNTVVIMTSNAGYSYDENKHRSIGFNALQDTNDKNKQEVTMKALEKTFRPEFLNRLDKVVAFNSLEKDNINRIVEIMLSEVTKNLKEQGIVIKFSDSLIEYIGDTGFSSKYGARNIKRAIQDTVEDYLADLVITDSVTNGDRILIDIDNGVIKHNNINEEIWC